MGGIGGIVYQREGEVHLDRSQQTCNVNWPNRYCCDFRIPNHFRARIGHWFEVATCHVCRDSAWMSALCPLCSRRMMRKCSSPSAHFGRPFRSVCVPLFITFVLLIPVVGCFAFPLVRFRFPPTPSYLPILVVGFLAIFARAVVFFHA